jgi:hypothetical protein
MLYKEGTSGSYTECKDEDGKKRLKKWEKGISNEKGWESGKKKKRIRKRSIKRKLKKKERKKGGRHKNN